MNGLNIKFGAFLIFGVVVSSVLFAGWDPYYLIDLDLIDSAYCNHLERDDYLRLKEDVYRKTKNSWCTQEKADLIMDLIVLTQPKLCVEIGVFTGASFLPVAAAVKFLGEGEVVAIDPWSTHEAIKYMAHHDPNKEWWSRVDFEKIYLDFQAVLRQWGLHSYCHVFRSPSEKVVHEIKKEIDFLHIDGNYAKTVALKDVDLYVPKVKKGGYILFSNLFLSINHQQPRMAAFSKLLDSCEILCDIDNHNSVLLRKMID